MGRRIQDLKIEDVDLRVSSTDIDVTVRWIVINVVYLEFVAPMLLVENSQTLDPQSPGVLEYVNFNIFRNACQLHRIALPAILS